LPGTRRRVYARAVLFVTEEGVREVRLSRRERQLFMLLCEHPRRVVPREEIRWVIWGGYCNDDSDKELVRQLRRRLATAGVEGCVVSVRGLGYALRRG